MTRRLLSPFILHVYFPVWILLQVESVDKLHKQLKYWNEGIFYKISYFLDSQQQPVALLSFCNPGRIVNLFSLSATTVKILPNPKEEKSVACPKDRGKPVARGASPPLLCHW